MEPIKIRMFSDYVCPWCYLGYGILKSLARQYPLSVEHVGFEIHPETPKNGVPFRNVRPDADSMLADIRGRAKEYGLVFGNIDKLSNSKDALLVGEYAKEQGKGEVFSVAIWKAGFERGLDIGDKMVIYEAAGEAGISAIDVERAIHNSSYARILDDNRREARKWNIHVIPAFVINGTRLIAGAPPESEFRAILDEALAPIDNNLPSHATLL